MKTKLIIALSVQLLLSPAQLIADGDVSEVSVLEVMENVITPATNILWAADAPQTDEEWKALDNAATTMVAITSFLKHGGNGPSDQDWASQPTWQALTISMDMAALQARQAIKDKNLEALLEAGNAIYEPCEVCHLQFNPGVIEQ